MSEIQLQNVEAVRQFTPTIHTDTYAYIAPPESGDLAGRSVFITGASKGIGRAAALSYARAGFTRIAVGARSDLTGLVAELREVAAARARTETGGEPEAAAARIVAVPLDVTSEDSVRGAVATIERELCGDGAGLDVLINNAGYLEPWVPVGDSDTAKWWRSWDVNVRGTYLVLQHCMPLLLRGTLRTNILTSSIGVLLPRHGASAYASAKFAICRLAESLDVDYRDKGLVSFAIHPGAVKTELATNMPKEYHQFLVDEPELAGDTIMWLGKERRPWLGGRFISVNWDMKELVAKKDDIVKKDLLKFMMTV